MADQGRKRPARGYVASRFDEITLAAFTALLIITVAAVPSAWRPRRTASAAG